MANANLIIEPSQKLNRRHSGSALGASSKVYFRVIYALMLHDVKTRFFGSWKGQIVMILWPFIHIVVLMVMYSVTGRIVPYGDSLLLYSCTGAVPWIVFSYMSRWVVASAAFNRQFLNYPLVMPLDLLVARCVVETVSSTVLVSLIVLLLFVLEVDAWPHDVSQAAFAFGMSILLAVAFGILNGSVALLMPLWTTVYALLMIVCYFVSGVIISPTIFPERVQHIMSYNPFLQNVEWMRAAFYADYPTHILDRRYTLEVAVVTLALGFILERVVRRYVH